MQNGVNDEMVEGSYSGKKREPERGVLQGDAAITGVLSYSGGVRGI